MINSETIEIRANLRLAMQNAFSNALIAPGYAMVLPPTKRLELVLTTNDITASRYELAGDRYLYSLLATVLTDHRQGLSSEFLELAMQTMTCNRNLIALMDRAQIGYRKRVRTRPKYTADKLEHILGVSYEENPLSTMEEWAEKVFGPLIDAMHTAYSAFCIVQDSRQLSYSSHSGMSTSRLRSRPAANSAPVTHPGLLAAALDWTSHGSVEPANGDLRSIGIYGSNYLPGGSSNTSFPSPNYAPYRLPFNDTLHQRGRGEDRTPSSPGLALHSILRNIISSPFFPPSVQAHNSAYTTQNATAAGPSINDCALLDNSHSSGRRF
ncbi:hypothetical protein D9615_003234 [Tricholomella constricta]|uniref:Uncharacterized protein n=1 Tax=Tricholomella constricta TaxID=117010 RepID=A0A8H5HJ56_9AGAR|nr:hypothetical protein D9615_003234 [Tricholomella constricta]